VFTEPASQPAGKAGTAARPFRVSVVCSGNICRSPIGEQVLRAAFAEAGLGDRVEVSSAGTGSWHVGQGADPQAVAVLAAAGYPTEHTARQISAADLDHLDLVLAADRGHLRELRRMTDDPQKVVLLRSFDPAAAGTHSEIPDPYNGPRSGFEHVLAITRAAAPHVVAAVHERLDR
jgi:protein-tyrosine phosphatase